MKSDKLAGMAIGSLLIISAILSNSSTGFRVGTISKVSTNGLICKTHEAVLKPLNDSGAYVWEFSVNDSDVWKKIEKAAENGKPVKVTYDHKRVSLFWRGETTFFATDVSAIGS